jgi:hypothetical protein
VQRLWTFAKRHGVDVLIVAAAVDSALEVALRRDDARAPKSSLWFPYLQSPVSAYPF